MYLTFQCDSCDIVFMFCVESHLHAIVKYLDYVGVDECVMQSSTRLNKGVVELIKRTYKYSSSNVFNDRLIYRNYSVPLPDSLGGALKFSCIGGC